MARTIWDSFVESPVSDVSAVLRFNHSCGQQVGRETSSSCRLIQPPKTFSEGQVVAVTISV